MEILLLCLAAFSAGFIDSIVGGGGLIQLPALMIVLPQYPIVTLLASNKMVSISGTGLAAYRYSKHLDFNPQILIPCLITAFIMSIFGALSVTYVPNDFLRPIFMCCLFLVFILTIRSKSFGLVNHDPHVQIPLWKPLILGCSIGFYDGFFGPGTGSFLIIGFVGLIGMTFVHGSAYAKVVNLTTNMGALLLFSFKTKFLFSYIIPMAIFSMLGAFLGVRLALLKGNEFVRILLRLVVFSTILKLGYDSLLFE
jgi:uncharacterized protein